MKTYKQIKFKDRRDSRPDGEGSEYTMEARIMEDDETVHNGRCIMIDYGGLGENVLFGTNRFNGKKVADVRSRCSCKDFAILRNYDE